MNKLLTTKSEQINFFLEFHAFQNKFLSETFFIYIDGENTPKWRCHKNPVKVDTSKIEIYFVTHMFPDMASFLLIPNNQL